jgi:solute carrier family 25 phosphate transporter 23/24/25/41
MHIPIVSLTPADLKSGGGVLTENSDVLRRRFQINTMSGMGYQYKSLPDAVRVIVTQEGIKGLYKGIIPNLLKVAPSMASSWLSFELCRDFLVSLKPEEEPLLQ